MHEIELKGPADGNPFVDVRVSAVFDNGTTRVEVPGFYDGGGVYRIRVMPETAFSSTVEARAAMVIGVSLRYRAVPMTSS